MGYLPTGASDPELLAIAKERLELDKQRLAAAKRGAILEGIRTAVAVAIPVAALLGIRRYFEWIEGRSR